MKQHAFLGRTGLLIAITVALCGPGVPGAVAAEKITLKVVKVDSEETSGEDGKAANAVDGDPATIWHTQWQDASPACPHEIILELSRTATIKGFTYLPRQDESDHGIIKKFEFSVSEDGKEFGSPAQRGTFEPGREKKTLLFSPVRAKFVRLRALSEINDEPYTSAAEITVIDESEAVSVKPKLSLVRVDSEETGGEDGKGANAVDGNTNTFWHTQWQDNTAPLPHEIVIELDPPMPIKGFSYLPRQDGNDHGTIKDYEFSVSQDGRDFGTPVKKGTFEDGPARKTVNFEARPARYIKLKALSEVNGGAWTSAAEIEVIP